MTVRVKRGRLRLALWFPNCLLGSMVKSIVKHECEKRGLTVSQPKETVKQIVRELRKAKKIHKKLELVSVKAADGTRVRIVL